MSADRITTGTLDASKVTVKNLNANNITSGTISAERIDVNNLAISKLKVSGQIAIDAYSTNDIYIGGTKNGGNFRNVNIYANRYIYIGNYTYFNMQRIVIDTENRIIRSSTGGYPWELGNYNYPFSRVATTSLYVYGGNISLGNDRAKLGFFGTSPVSKKTVSNASGSTVSDAITAINNLISALRSYGLIG